MSNPSAAEDVSTASSTTATTAPSPASHSEGAVSNGLSILGFWLMLVLWGLSRFPIPAINEPHYLGKAKHFWDASWCAGDFFLNSSNPHLLFYLTFGWLTWFFSLWTSTLLARIACLGVVAIGWQALTRPLLSTFSWQALALTLCLAFHAVANFSGEWLVIGAESKVPAYGFGFWAVGLVLQRKLLAAACLLGLATAFHPVVGVWLTLCVLGGVLWNRLASRVSEISQPRWFDAKQGLRLSMGWLVCSLPGLIPAIQVLLEPVADRTRFVGDYLQVYYRLRHHLDPMEFSGQAYALYAGLTVLALFGYWRERQRARRTGFPVPAALQLLMGFFLVSLLVAAVGVLVGWRSGPPAEMPWFHFRLKLLKFYPFRVFDLLAPLLVIVLALREARHHWGQSRNLWVKHGWNFAWIVVFGLCAGSFASHSYLYPRSAKHRDWLAVCQWVKENTPSEALILAQVRPNTFKWYAERAEFVSFKDCPQEASGIVEWNNRLLLLKNWGADSYDDQLIDSLEVAALAEKTGIHYLLVERLGPFEQPPVYQNGHYRVYATPQNPESGAK